MFWKLKNAKDWINSKSDVGFFMFYFNVMNSVNFSVFIYYEDNKKRDLYYTLFP